MKIDDITMLKLAGKKVKTAQNEDWHRNGAGGIELVGESKEMPLFGWDKRKSHSPKSFGMATVAFFKFLKPVEDKYKDFLLDFIGFTLAAIEMKGKMTCGTHPVIDGFLKGMEKKPNQDDYNQAAIDLEDQFCPRCFSPNSTKFSRKKLGPECVQITETCKICGKVDVDILD